MTIKTKTKSHPSSRVSRNFPFTIRTLKDIKPNVKCLKNIDLLSERPFYEELSVIKTKCTFKGHAMSYKVEVIQRKDPITQK